MRRALALVVFVATGCGVAASVPAPKPPTIPLSSSVPPTPSAPPTPSSPPAPRAAIVVGNERGVFLPDGRLAVQLAHGQYVTTPERPEQGEIVPFEGTLHVAGARVFGIASAAGRFRFVELDAQLHEVRGIDLGKMPLVGMTADGEYLVLRRAGKALLLRTRDFSTVVEGVNASFDGRSLFALVPTSLDGRYAVGATQVVDLEKGKIVFSHSALRESAWLIEKGRFHWVFSDLLETVDLATGARTQTWLPCGGHSAADAEAATFYTACNGSVARTSLASTAPKTDLLKIAVPDVQRFVVETSGRVVASTYVRAPGPEGARGGVTSGPLLAMERGGKAFRPENEVKAPSKLSIEPSANHLVGKMVRLPSGKTIPLVHYVSASPVSRDGRFAYAGGRLVELESGRKVPVLSSGTASVTRVTIRDGAFVVSISGEPSKDVHEVRVVPSTAQSLKERVRVVHPETAPGAEPTWDVVIEDEAGHRTGGFSVDLEARTGEVSGDGIVLRSDSLDGSFRYCTRSGKCKGFSSERGSTGLGKTFAFHAPRDGRTVYVDDLVSEESVGVDVGDPVVSATATDEGIYAVVERNGRKLVFVSATAKRVVRKLPLGIDGTLVGVLGSQLVFAESNIVHLVDATTLARKEAYAFAEKGYLHIHEDGHYTTHGAASEVTALVQCLEGSRVVPRERCTLR